MNPNLSEVILLGIAILIAFFVSLFVAARGRRADIPTTLMRSLIASGLALASAVFVGVLVEGLYDNHSLRHAINQALGACILIGFGAWVFTAPASLLGSALVIFFRRA